MDRETADFAALALDFCGEGIYPQFLAFMEQAGYSEGEVERLTAEVDKAAGRVG